MERRTFTQLIALSPLLAEAPPATVALITHSDGPHLGTYIEALAQIADVRRVWLCDPTGATEPLVRKGLGEKLGGAFRTPQDLFAKHKPLLALITMEAAQASLMINAALDAGCHVLAEKPACTNSAEFEPLATKAKARGRHLMLALCNRIDPVMAEARRVVHSGQIGRVYGMEMHTIADQTRLTRESYQRSWIAQKKRAGGGHLVWLGVHWLDLAMFITGSSITQVAGFAGNVGGQPIDTEDSASVSFRFANGTFGNLTSGYFLDRGKQLYIKIWGSHGWLEIHHERPDNPLEWYSTKPARPEVQRFQPTSPGGYTPFVAHVVRAALGVEPPVLNADDSLRVLRTVFAAYRAAESGQTQAVESQ